MASKYAFTSGLKELRFLLCQTSQHSDATRQFLRRAYPVMKKHNPYVPVLVREASNTEPRVFARYAYGKEKSESLVGLTDAEIEQRVSALAKQA